MSKPQNYSNFILIVVDMICEEIKFKLILMMPTYTTVLGFSQQFLYHEKFQQMQIDSE